MMTREELRPILDQIQTVLETFNAELSTISEILIPLKERVKALEDINNGK